ncbi:hypothetical protein NC652_030727 [Populus alba x Populus x berolinensis]|uniref:Uncharacterized protein n=1 Tax=Populus alba x Populus x berolinensis TaxID=444605 RepID=A0AAD6LWF1_9ROSI|nr:hypothetical protein NC652_030727 [Populus alba x Populus x berolinensis]KAJ6974397.1 hypothetical protein NC653_030487 [Populus alba x Populus x berolinensis]
MGISDSSEADHWCMGSSEPTTRPQVSPPWKEVTDMPWKTSKLMGPPLGCHSIAGVRID